MITFESTPLSDTPALDWQALASERATVIDPGLREAFTAHEASAA